MSLGSFNETELLDQLFSIEMLRIASHGIHRLADPSQLFGYEALMRGPRGAPYESPPMAFSMAATLNLMERLDTRCVQLAAQISGRGMLFINVHPRTIVSHEDFWATIAAFGEDGTRPPDEIVFEIVEHSSARESQLLHSLRELRSMGFKIAVDDLGEGAAGLRRLVEFAPEFAKIDRFFIDGIDQDRRRRVVVQSLIAVAAELGITIIAEGIEREEELRVLKDLGAPLGQGYLFGKPEEQACRKSSSHESRG